MKELTINEVKEVSGGFRPSGNYIPGITGNPFVTGILYLGSTLGGAMIIDGLKKFMRIQLHMDAD